MRRMCVPNNSAVRVISTEIKYSLIYRAHYVRLLNEVIDKEVGTAADGTTLHPISRCPPGALDTTPTYHKLLAHSTLPRVNITLYVTKTIEMDLGPSDNNRTFKSGIVYIIL